MEKATPIPVPAIAPEKAVKQAKPATQRITKEDKSAAAEKTK
jgi:hypothetical protein